MYIIFIHLDFYTIYTRIYFSHKSSLPPLSRYPPASLPTVLALRTEALSMITHCSKVTKLLQVSSIVPVDF
jgi:hypothetical protein